MTCACDQMRRSAPRRMQTHATSQHTCRAEAAFGPCSASSARSSWMWMSTLRPLACSRHRMVRQCHGRNKLSRARLESAQVLADVRKIFLAAAGVNDDVQVVVLHLEGGNIAGA